MKISLACDHGGLDLKNEVKAHLEKRGFAVRDFGTFSKESCDYPDFARPAAEAVVPSQTDTSPRREDTRSSRAEALEVLSSL